VYTTKKHQKIILAFTITFTSTPSKLAINKMNASSEYQLNIEEQYVYSKFEGDIHASDIIDLVNKLRADPNFNPKFNSIADLRKASISQEFSEAAELASFVKNTYHQRGYFRLAFIVGEKSSEWYGILKAISSIDDTPMLINSFETLAQAQDWVN